MGLVQKLDFERYWSQDEAIAMPFFSANMSTNRFQAILSNLHLVNNENTVAQGQPGHDPLYYIRPFFTMVQSNYRDAYTPDNNIAYDGRIVPMERSSQIQGI